MKLVVITGASRGIGRATALRLAERGVGLALVGRPSTELDDTARRASDAGATVTVTQCDLGASSDVDRAASEIRATRGTPDVVVHNAAHIERGRVVDLSVAAWDRHMEVNVRGPFLLTRAFLPKMVARGSGRHVFVASISATLGTAGAAPYCASKWALVGFVKSLAEEISDTGVTTVAVLPGSVGTRMLEGSGFTPRMSADDVARTLVFHALDAPDAHNGGIVEMFGT
jgi:3-oxoacyl-[acyl-carrier protein] reductase